MIKLIGTEETEQKKEYTPEQKLAYYKQKVAYFEKLIFDKKLEELVNAKIEKLIHEKK